MKVLSTLKSFMLQCGRVWRIMRKPTNEEFKTISKVSAIGMLLIGLIGFLVAIIVNFFF
jgi:protein transport protein SEC61 subunit gamma and related proteins